MTELLIHPSHLNQNHLYPSNITISNFTLTKTAPQKPSGSSKTSLRICEDEELPKGFSPGPFDVICSQGKTAKVHAGNIYFQSVIHRWAKQYSNTIEKRNKSKIVRTIIETIQAKSPNSGFVKKTGDDRWRTVGLDQAREKVSQSLRDTLAGHYRSSLKAKKRSRMESNLKRMIDFEEIIASNKFVSERITWLSDTIKNSNDSSHKSNLSDVEVLKIMNDTNMCILRQLKQDRTVQQKVLGTQPQKLMESQDKCRIQASPPYEGVDETLKMFQTNKGFLLLQEPALKRSKS